MNVLKLEEGWMDSFEEKSRSYEISDKDIVPGCIMDIKGRLCRVLEVLENNTVMVQIGGYRNKFDTLIVEPRDLEKVMGFVDPRF